MSETCCTRTINGHTLAEYLADPSLACGLSVACLAKLRQEMRIVYGYKLGFVQSWEEARRKDCERMVEKAGQVLMIGTTVAPEAEDGTQTVYLPSCLLDRFVRQLVGEVRIVVENPQLGPQEVVWGGLEEHTHHIGQNYYGLTGAWVQVEPGNEVYIGAHYLSSDGPLSFETFAGTIEQAQVAGLPTNP